MRLRLGIEVDALHFGNLLRCHLLDVPLKASRGEMLVLLWHQIEGRSVVVIEEREIHVQQRVYLGKFSADVPAVRRYAPSLDGIEGARGLLYWLLSKEGDDLVAHRKR